MYLQSTTTQKESKSYHCGQVAVETFYRFMVEQDYES